MVELGEWPSGSNRKPLRGGVTDCIAIVGGTLESTIELAGRSMLGKRSDVVHIATRRRHIAVRWMGAVPITDLNRATDRTGEPSTMRYRDHGVRPVKEHRLKICRAERRN